MDDAGTRGRGDSERRRFPNNAGPRRFDPRHRNRPPRPFNPESSQSTSPDLVYGRRPIHEVLKGGKRTLHKLWIAKGSTGGIVEEIIGMARSRGVPIEFVEGNRLDQQVRGNHQGLVAQVSAVEYQELDELLRSLGADTLRSADAPTPRRLVVLALDEIQDPQNVGAILRSAGFFGVTAVLVPRWRSAPVGDTASRTSAGAIEHVPMVRVRNLADAILDLKEAGFEVIGADAEGAPLAGVQAGERVALIVGNEGSGLRRLVKERCDKLVGIPRGGAIDSLNVASATAILLYEMFRK